MLCHDDAVQVIDLVLENLPVCHHRHEVNMRDDFAFALKVEVLDYDLLTAFNIALHFREAETAFPVRRDFAGLAEKLGVDDNFEAAMEFVGAIVAAEVEDDKQTQVEPNLRSCDAKALACPYFVFISLIRVYNSVLQGVDDLVSLRGQGKLHKLGLLAKDCLEETCGRVVKDLRSH